MHKQCQHVAATSSICWPSSCRPWPRWSAPSRWARPKMKPSAWSCPSCSRCCFIHCLQPAHMRFDTCLLLTPSPAVIRWPQSGQHACCIPLPATSREMIACSLPCVLLGPCCACVCCKELMQLSNVGCSHHATLYYQQAMFFVNWVGHVWQAGSLSLPCREMCEAVISTCSCGRERTLGSLLDGVVSGLLVSLFSCPLAGGHTCSIVPRL